jgi:hypothetical protein
MDMRKADTRKVKFVKDGTLIVAVDIGMEMNRGYCTTPDGRDIKPFKFDNTREGMDKLWSMVIASKNRFQCEEIIVGYESTGPYGSLPDEKAGYGGSGQSYAHKKDKGTKWQFSFEDR